MDDRELILEEGEVNESPPEAPGEDETAVKSDVEEALEILLGVEQAAEIPVTAGIRKASRAKAHPVTLADRARAFRARIDALEAEREVRNESK